MLKKFNSFNKNLQFTVDKFENETPHFLDLEIHPDGLTIYRKNTHTGQFVNFSSYSKWNYKTAWIRSLISRAVKICSQNKLTAEFKKIKLFASYNGYPKHIVNSIFKKHKCNDDVSNNNDNVDDEITKLYLSLPYQGIKGEHIVKKMQHKIHHCFKKDITIKLIVTYNTTKLAYFTSTKDRTPKLSESYVVYQFQCPGCSAKYIGETQTTLYKRTQQHGHEQKDSAVYQHLLSCHGYQHTTDIHKIHFEEFNDVAYRINQVRDNTKIIGKTRDWLKLYFMEALAIKDHDPELNNGLKATKKLQLF